MTDELSCLSSPCGSASLRRLAYKACLMQNGELVAQFKATVLLMPNGSDRVTSAPLQKLETEKKVQHTPSLQNPLSAVHHR